MSALEEVIVLGGEQSVDGYVRHVDAGARTACGIGLGPSLSDYGVKPPRHERELAERAPRCQRDGCRQRWPE